uniref:Uncharacterized protein n=1 Tax=Anguilla anguilla TaxID=7936 RepID=A0A0E9XIA2_ANGAN
MYPLFNYSYAFFK